MKTWQAFLVHMGTTAAQAALAVPFFDSNKPTGLLTNLGIQVAAQTGLSALQLFVASKNSNSDPKGNPLVQTGPSTFTTEPKI